MRSDHVLTTLKVVGSLQEGQKLSVRSGLVSIDKKPASFIRWINGDSRSTTLSYIYAVVNEALLLNLDAELIASIEGFKTLKVTYSGDEATVAYIDVILDKMTRTNKKTPTSKDGR